MMNPFTANPPMASSDAPDFRSYVFLLAADGVQPLEHALYVALCRGEQRLPARAGHAVRIADWYVKLVAGRPAELVNEWYGWARFDAEGRLQPHGGRALANNATAAAERDNIDTAALPGPAELAAMRAHVFGD